MTRAQKFFFLVLSAYALWALAYIFHSSYVASDDKRYFNLFDDAMISMRYAWNFSHGRGLVWNAGEYVEGYTNPLMTLLMSAAAFLLEKRYAVLAVQLLGVLFPPLAAFFAMKIFESAQPAKTSLPAALVFLLSLFYYPLNFWSLMGMETGLLAALLGAGVYLSIQYEKRRQEKFLWGMALCFGLAHWTRNESTLFAAAAFSYLLPALWRGKKEARAFLASGIFYSLFALAQVAFRYEYYGELLPNTYTLKLVGMSLTDRLQNGLGFILPYLKETGFVLALALAGAFWKPARWKTYLLALFALALAYQIYVGGDAWNYWRMMTPFAPFLFALYISTLADFISRPQLAAAALLAFALVNARFAGEFTLLNLPYQNAYARAHVEAALALEQVTAPDAPIGVFWAGSLPYYLDRYAIDFLGKSDPYIASLPPDMSGQSAGFGMKSMPGHNKHDLSYSIQTLQPVYVEEFSYGKDNLEDWGRAHYVRVKINGAKLYLLKDSPQVKWRLIKDKLNW